MNTAGATDTRTHLDANRRARDLEALAGGQQVDVLVVGGGVTGAGVALDAASRGLSVALLERRDLASGTSRWSSKLAHGGLRYLTKGQFGIAWESARERALLIDRLAPHLARGLPFLLPVDDDVPRRDRALLEAGLRMGDALRILAGTSRRRLPPVRRVSRDEALRWAPALRAEGMRGALLHWDAQLEDDARLVVAIARTAARHGARIVTYAPALALHDGGATARDELTGASFEVRARHVVNATGVWAAQLAPAVQLRPSRGAHLLVPAARLGDPRAAVSVAVPGAFGRFVFAWPRADGLVLVGLTDDPVDGPVVDEPVASTEDEAWMLGILGRALDRPLTPADVVGRYAGLRPLVASGDEVAGATADLARDHLVVEEPDSGTLSVVGGKLTTYRAMAQEVVDRIAARPGVEAGPCATRRLPLVGAPPPGPRGTAPLRPDGVPAALWRRYGTEAAELLALAGGRAELLEPLAPGVPALGVELVAAQRRELALTLSDALDRRTRVGLVPAWREAALARARELLPDLAEREEVAG